MQEFFATTANLPNAFIGPPPVLGKPSQNALQAVPFINTEAVSIFAGEIDRIRQLSIKIQLELIPRAVSDANGPRISVSAQVVEFHFERIRRTVRSVQDLQWAKVSFIIQSVVDPQLETGCFLYKAKAHHCVKCEGGVAEPGVAIIPVAAATNLFGQAECGRRNDRSMLAISKELQQQGGTAHHLPPPARIVRLRDPLSPVLCGLSKSRFDLIYIQWLSCTRVILAKRENNLLSGLETERLNDTLIIRCEWKIRI